MSDKKANRSFGGKGYYIALILCAAAIGISGYVYYNQAEPAASVEDSPVLSTEDVSLYDGTTTTPTQAATVPTEASTEATAGKLATCAPVEGEVLAEYAMECLSYNQTTRDWRVHNGVDIAAATGTEVVAAADGQVYTIYEDDQMGMTVVIRHDNGYTTKYSSLASEVAVSAGENVQMGQTIGYVGCSALMESAIGDHVHFTVTLNDEVVDPGEFIG